MLYYNTSPLVYSDEDKPHSTQSVALHNLSGRSIIWIADVILFHPTMNTILSRRRVGFSHQWSSIERSYRTSGLRRHLWCCRLQQDPLLWHVPRLLDYRSIPTDGMKLHKLRDIVLLANFVVGIGPLTPINLTSKAPSSVFD